MKKFIVALLLSTNIAMLSMVDHHGSVVLSASDFEPHYSRPVASHEMLYTKPIGNENHIFRIPNELIQAIVIEADHNDGKRLLATCKSLHEGSYKLDCPSHTIQLHKFFWFDFFANKSSDIMGLVTNNRLVTYKNPLKLTVDNTTQEETITYFFRAFNNVLLVDELSIESNNWRFLSALSKHLKTSTQNVATLSLVQNFADCFEAATQFAQSLSKNKSITELNLCGSNINSNGLLVSMLMTNPTLKKFNLDTTNIHPNEIAVIARNLKNNITLISLSLNNNKIGSNAFTVALLSDALKTNTSLTELHLNDNQLNYTGAAQFAECLVTNKTLKKLSLRNNNIGIYGARALAPYDVEYNLNGRELAILESSRDTSTLVAQLVGRSLCLANGICWTGLVLMSGPSIAGTFINGGFALSWFKAAFE